MNEIIQHALVHSRPECPKLFFSPSASLTSDPPQVLSDQSKRLFWHRRWLVESEPDILSIKLMSTQRGRKWATKSIEGRSMVTLWLFILVLRKVQKNFCHGDRGSICVCVWQRKSNVEHMAILRQMWQAELFTQSCSISVFAWFVSTVQTTFSHIYCLSSSELSLKSHHIFSICVNSKRKKYYSSTIIVEERIASLCSSSIHLLFLLSQSLLTIMMENNECDY